MNRFYVIFRPDQTVDVSQNNDFDDTYVHVKTRDKGGDTLEYYVHESQVDFYKTAFNVV